MKASRKHWWIKVDHSGRPVQGAIIYAEFPPRLANGLGKYYNIDDCIGLCCEPTTTTTTTSTTTTTTTTL